MCYNTLWHILITTDQTEEMIVAVTDEAHLALSQIVVSVIHVHLTDQHLNFTQLHVLNAVNHAWFHS